VVFGKEGPARSGGGLQDTLSFFANLQDWCQTSFSGSDVGVPNRPKNRTDVALTDFFKKQDEIDKIVAATHENFNPQIKALYGQMLEILKNYLAQVEAEVVEAQSRIDQLQKEVDAVVAKFNPDNLVRDLLDYRQAQRDYDEKLGLLNAIKIRLNQVKADEFLMASPVRIIRRADAPKFPSSPNKILCLAISAMAGLLLGALIVSLVELGLWIGRRNRK
jgi:uncharacterized protein involved in exopolysaccharide biosynthesis